MRRSQPLEGGTGDQMHVLVIDDDPDMQRLLVDLVHGAGHVAVAGESAEEGLTLLTQWTFQVAFLDHNLPGMQGVLLGEYLRRHNPHIRIALVTGEDDPDLRRTTKRFDIEFVEKPFDDAIIRRILSDALEAARERMARMREATDEAFDPPIAEYVDQLEECYAIPKVPNRLQDRLVSTLKRHLNNLRSESRYTERDRVVALSGLLSAKVLGLDLPRTSTGRTLFEEYDDLMRQHGRRPEFGEDAA